MLKKIAYSAVIGLLVLSVLLCLFWLTEFEPKRPLLYKIANNYHGWAVVRYGDPSCPLGHESFYLVIDISSSGAGCTSLPLKPGWNANFYEYVSRDTVIRRLRQTHWGAGGEIWAGYLIPDKNSEVFFVGTEQELRKSWSQSPR